MEILSQLNENAPTVLMGLGGLGAVVTLALRRISRDRVELVKDRAEENLIESLQTVVKHTLEERNRIVDRFAAVEAERNEAISKVGQLSAQVHYLTEQVKNLQQTVLDLSVKIDTTNESLKSTQIENAKLSTQLAHVTK